MGIVGYAPGVYDMFHIGHLNILRRARLQCDWLIAGVVSDEVAFQQKQHYPVIPEDERLDIVANIEFVDQAVMEWTTDKLVTWERVGFDVIFKGDDWRGSEKWTRLEEEFRKVGVLVLYLPYTEHTSSTVLRALIADRDGPLASGL
jgi:glycerol-3-phosphate cytidylyltransferase